MKKTSPMCRPDFYYYNATCKCVDRDPQGSLSENHGTYLFFACCFGALTTSQKDRKEPGHRHIGTSKVRVPFGSQRFVS